MLYKNKHPDMYDFFLNHFDNMLWITSTFTSIRKSWLTISTLAKKIYVY